MAERKRSRTTVMLHKLKALAAFLRRPFRVTCLGCGFLAYKGADEVYKATRLVLPSKGTIPLSEEYVDNLRCSRSLWVGFAVHGDPPLDEVSIHRHCEGFRRYKPGLSPQEHMKCLLDFDQRNAQFGYTLLAALLAAVLALVGQTGQQWLAKSLGLSTPLNAATAQSHSPRKN